MGNISKHRPYRSTYRFFGSALAVIEHGRELASDRANSSHGGWDETVERETGKSRQRAFKIMKIAVDRRIVELANASCLPASWTTLYELTKISDEAFLVKLLAGVVRPAMTRADATNEPTRAEVQITVRKLERVTRRLAIAQDVINARLA